MVLLLYRDLVGPEGGWLREEIVLQYKALYCHLRGLAGRQAVSRYKHCIMIAIAGMAWVVWQGRRQCVTIQNFVS